MQIKMQLFIKFVQCLYVVTLNIRTIANDCTFVLSHGIYDEMCYTLNTLQRYEKICTNANYFA